ncbi:efflux RND transporter periplasmic adaptor subunit [Pontibacter sp. BT310]|jgi:HlyD family secretion protein|uniref:Efflux RND transporter periplasmic adaptor subunit n=1 Tax=Pontibacter populi TaxID=890055 RepID=A0ABS6XDE5_9BACT|nr:MULTISPECIES: efflux RND transporter periplasmic adaptor subunit [Pontibacter]MBJ6118825.1 efflux RND transporter periplasmic adaptor subunit [Pontibacter sp. BT310]MBR0571253.1 efflux RND transporter periplasmic adaptor subunit [Microvirga sp. STS03]MBW3365679.1 efflux RND transporter periplasmic adaptor subunit [Pontibacter populi]
MDRVIEKKKYTPKKIALIAAVTLVLVIVIYNLLFAEHTSKLNVEAQRITIGNVQEGTFQEFIAVDGSVDPLKTFFLDITEGGRVEKIYTDDGKMVEKGDTILKLSNTTLQIDFMTRETQLYDLMNERQNSEILMKQDQIRKMNELAEIDYNLTTAERTYNRNKMLIAEGAISKEEYEASKDNYQYLKHRKELGERSVRQDAKLMDDRLRQLDESINRMQANINMARNTLNNLYVLAPFTGQLSTLKAEVGESIAAGENIGQVDDLNGYKVKANIDEHYISRVYPGLDGSFDFNGKTYKVKVAKVFPEVQNNTFQVDMEFAGGTPEGIRRGQTLQLKLNLNDGGKAILLPRGGFYQSTGGNWVFVVDKSGSFAEKRTIKLGRQNPNHYEVIEGLKPGEKVIVSSYDSYGDIDRLELK